MANQIINESKSNASVNPSYPNSSESACSITKRIAKAAIDVGLWILDDIEIPYCWESIKDPKTITNKIKSLEQIQEYIRNLKIEGTDITLCEKIHWLDVISRCYRTALLAVQVLDIYKPFSREKVIQESTNGNADVKGSSEVLEKISLSMAIDGNKSLSPGIYQAMYLTLLSEHVEWDNLPLLETIQKMKLYKEYFPFFSQSKCTQPLLRQQCQKATENYVVLIAEAEEILHQDFLSDSCKLTNPQFFENAEKISKMLIEYFSKGALEGNLNVDKLSRLCGINAANINGQTALEEAAYKGHLLMAKLLIDKGANVNASENNGNTALTWAILKDALDIVKALIDKDADVNIITKKGNTPLIIASFKAHLNIVKALIDKGTNINAVDKDGNTSLIIAIRDNHLDIALELIQEGANVNLANNNGGTALGIAANTDHLAMVKILIYKDANVNAVDKFGCTALMAAVIPGHLETTKFLIEKGANVNAVDKDGNTPLTLAIQKNHSDIAQELIQKNAIGVVENIATRCNHIALKLFQKV